MLDISSSLPQFVDQAGIHSGQQPREKLDLVLKAFARLPYENITKIIRFHQAATWEEARRMPAEVLSDHFRWATGGTCFSLTHTLREILRHLDFDPRILMADMKMGEDVHCGLVLTLDGADYLIDPGYLVDRPIALHAGEPTILQTPMNELCLESADAGETYSISVIRKGEKKIRYRLKTGPVKQEEFLRYWDRSFTLNMMNSLTLSKVTVAGQLYFSRSRLQMVTGQSRKSKNARGLEIPCIEEVFQINPTLVGQALEILQNSHRGESLP